MPVAAGPSEAYIRADHTAGGWEREGIAPRDDNRDAPIPLIESTRSLIEARRFTDAARALEAFLESAPVGASAPIARSLRELCVVAAEHRIRGDRLEAECRAHRAAERELRPVVDAMLVSWQAALDPCAEPGSERLSDVSPAASVAPAGRESRPDVEVGVLGPLEVAIHGQRVDRWDSLKARSIFQYLVVHADQPVRREVLMETIWPGYTRDSARNNLNVGVYNLRRTLGSRQGEHCIIYVDGCYALDPQMAWWIDRDEFLDAFARATTYRRAGRHQEAIEAYRKGLALYRGPMLDDDPVSEWHLDEQRYLEDACLAALEQVGELHLELDDPVEAGRAARKALAVDPCRESAHRLIMRCYAREHQHHLVSRQLKICTRTLRRELGIMPAPETIQVFEALTNPAPGRLPRWADPGDRMGRVN
jgi:DNA-binding SARP family transcriptional activator